jgi:hypothetical protein
MSGRKLTLAVTLAALAYLGVEVPEGITPAEANDKLDETLGDYNLTQEQFVTPEALFALGYQRGLVGGSFAEETEVPKDAEGKTDRSLADALEDGFSFGLEARNTPAAPPPSLVFAALKEGKLKTGGFGEWAKGLDLTGTKRLAAALNVGSGKGAITIPAGTPVDVLAEGVVKDGVPHVVVGYGGVALIVPNPESDPKLVTGDVVVSKAKRKSPGTGTSKPRKPKAEGSAEPRERGPVLQAVIIDVIEGKDGGPGPLQDNGAFAGRVLALARERGIGAKASNFVAKADRHVPYYLNCYHPTKEGHTGRLGVATPLAHTVAAIKARKFFLSAPPGSTFEQRMAAVPPELRTMMEDKEARLTTTAPPIVEKPAKAEGSTEPAAEGSTEPATEPAAEPAAEGTAEAAPAKSKGKKPKAEASA